MCVCVRARAACLRGVVAEQELLALGVEGPVPDGPAAVLLHPLNIYIYIYIYIYQ